MLSQWMPIGIKDIHVLRIRWRAEYVWKNDLEISGTTRIQKVSNVLDFISQ